MAGHHPVIEESKDTCNHSNDDSHKQLNDVNLMVETTEITLVPNNVKVCQIISLTWPAYTYTSFIGPAQFANEIYSPTNPLSMNPRTTLFSVNFDMRYFTYIFSINTIYTWNYMYTKLILFLCKLSLNVRRWIAHKLNIKRVPCYYLYFRVETLRFLYLFYWNNTFLDLILT